jgi:N-methylhydantoinase A
VSATEANLAGRFRIATDTGGTFTDLVIEDERGAWSLHKAATTPHDPVIGVMDALEKAASAKDLSRRELLSRVDMFVHGTTAALNAIVEGRVAKTAFLTTEGHRDILVLREGGREAPFKRSLPFPEPYIPRSLSFEIRGRIDAEGKVVEAFDRAAALEVLDRIRDLGVEAVGVCLLWSVKNPEHELALGTLIEECLPGVPYTLSHQLNPTIREYRRASSTCMDASLKPLMVRYVSSLSERLAKEGFAGRLLLMTSQGGMIDHGDLAAAPIHAINSGPSLAPIAGLRYADCEGLSGDIIVADTGGTTYDVSLIHRGKVPLSQDCWIGPRYTGHLTGFPSVDIRSVGAGGGSIAWIDGGGVLHVGPQSAGASPGPVCYGLGGTQPTVTDACLVLGYIDPGYFLDGTMQLDRNAARVCIETSLAEPLGLDVHEAAWSVLALATENMVQAIIDVTVNQGIDPEGSVLIGGGGAAGLNSTLIARRLGCKYLLFPELGAALSAAGGMLSDLTADFRESSFATTRQFDFETVNAVLGRLSGKCADFIDRSGVDASKSSVSFSVDARYENQVWTIETPLRAGALKTLEDVEDLVADFHHSHESVFAVRDERSAVEIINWQAKASCQLVETTVGHLSADPGDGRKRHYRQSYFPGPGESKTAVYPFATLPVGETVPGPAIVETPFTTIVIDPAARFWRTDRQNLIVEPRGSGE